jgi:hypothetical protein
MADLLNDDSKLLRQDTITALFTPQFLPNSAPAVALTQWSLIFAPMTGGEVSMGGVNYGLGGLILTEGSSFIPKNTLMWGGFTNPVWQVNREKGVAGWIGVQQLPPNDPQFVALCAIFWKEFWSTF